MDQIRNDNSNVIIDHGKSYEHNQVDDKIVSTIASDNGREDTNKITTVFTKLEFKELKMEMKDIPDHTNSSDKVSPTNVSNDYKSHSLEGGGKGKKNDMKSNFSSGIE